MDIQNYTPSIGRKMKILPSLTLGYGIILVGFSLFILIWYNAYSDYPECQYIDFRIYIYIISIENLLIGFLIISASIILLKSIRDWARGNITSRDYWDDFNSQYNTVLRLILLILQLSAIGFISSKVFRAFNISSCDPYLYYVLIANVYIFYNIIFVGIVLYLACYLISFLGAGLYKIITLMLEGYFCGNTFRLIGNFGLFNHGRISRQISPNTNPNTNPNNTNRTEQINIPIDVDANNKNITCVIPELVEFATPDDCAVCIEPQKTGIKFSQCSHWVCEVCWSQLMNTNPICPLCRAKIV